MTEAQAIALAKSNWWEGRDAHDIALFQLSEPLLCMPFGVLHKAVEEALGRPVLTHEFGSSGLLQELLGDKPAPTMQEILELIPAEKRLVIVIVEKAK